MESIKKVFLTAFLILFVANFLFASGQQEGQTTAEDEIEISYWHFPRADNVPGYEDVSKERGDFESYLAKKFTEMDNGISVETEVVPWNGGFERINVAIAGGDPPTVLLDYIGRTSVYNQMGATIPADKVLPAHVVDDVYSDYLDLYTTGGDLHGLPADDTSLDVMNINVGLLKKHGWEGPVLNGPGQPYSFEEFTEFLTDVKDVVPSDVYPTAWTGGDEQADYVWWLIFAGFGGELFDSDGTVTDDYSGMIEGYEYLMSLKEKGLLARGIASMKGNDGNKLFTAGKVVVRAGGKPHADDLKNNIEEGALDYEYEVMAVPFPTEAGDKVYNTVGPSGFVFFTDASDKETEAASEFIEFMLSEEYWPAYIQAIGRQALQKKYSNEDIFSGDAYMEQITGIESSLFDNGIANPNYQEIRIALSQAHQKIFTERATIEEAVNDFYEEVRELVNE